MPAIVNGNPKQHFGLHTVKHWMYIIINVFVHESVLAMLLLQLQYY